MNDLMRGLAGYASRPHLDPAHAAQRVGKWSSILHLGTSQLATKDEAMSKADDRTEIQKLAGTAVAGERLDLGVTTHEQTTGRHLRPGQQVRDGRDWATIEEVDSQLSDGLLPILTEWGWLLVWPYEWVDVRDTHMTYTEPEDQMPNNTGDDR